MPLRAALALLGLAGCGRISFDALGDGDGGVGGDARGDGSNTTGDGGGDSAMLVPFVIEIEAESGTAAPAFQFMSTGPETYVLDTNLAGEAGAGSVGFNVVIPRDADVYLWARVLTQDSSTDAFNVTFAPFGPFTYDTSECDFSGFWHWTAMRLDGTCVPLSSRRTFSLPAGNNSLFFTSREGGSRFDKLVVTNDPTYLPSP